MTVYLIVRRDQGNLAVVCQGPCEDFLRTYLKYNYSGRGRDTLSVLKAEEFPIEDYLESEATPSTSAEVKGKKKTVDAATK
jgi:hypothetical protein